MAYRDVAELKYGGTASSNRGYNFYDEEVLRFRGLDAFSQEERDMLECLGKNLANVVRATNAVLEGDASHAPSPNEQISRDCFDYLDQVREVLASKIESFPTDVVEGLKQTHAQLGELNRTSTCNARVDGIVTAVRTTIEEIAIMVERYQYFRFRTTLSKAAAYWGEDALDNESRYSFANYIYANTNYLIAAVVLLGITAVAWRYQKDNLGEALFVGETKFWDPESHLYNLLGYQSGYDFKLNELKRIKGNHSVHRHWRHSTGGGKGETMKRLFPVLETDPDTGKNIVVGHYHNGGFVSDTNWPAINRDGTTRITQIQNPLDAAHFTTLYYFKDINLLPWCDESGCYRLVNIGELDGQIGHESNKILAEFFRDVFYQPFEKIISDSPHSTELLTVLRQEYRDFWKNLESGEKPQALSLWESWSSWGWLFTSTARHGDANKFRNLIRVYYAALWDSVQKSQFSVSSWVVIQRIQTSMKQDLDRVVDINRAEEIEPNFKEALDMTANEMLSEPNVRSMMQVARHAGVETKRLMQSVSEYNKYIYPTATAILGLGSVLFVAHQSRKLFKSIMPSKSKRSYKKKSS